MICECKNTWPLNVFYHSNVMRQEQVPVHHEVLVQEPRATCDELTHRPASKRQFRQQNNSHPADLNEAAPCSRKCDGK